MSLLFNLYPAIRPLLFKMDAETAHERTLHRLQRLHDSPLKFAFPAPPIHPCKLLGLQLKNPIGLAAGLDKNGAHIDALASLGFGFIEVGTVTPKAQAGNPKPRMFRIPQAEGIINRMGFNNDGLDMFLRNVQASHFQRRGGILGLNIGKNASTPIEKASDDYLIGLEGVYPYADYVTINISSPNTQNLRSLQGGDELNSLLLALTEKRQALSSIYQKQVPILVKIAPDLDTEQIHLLVDTLQRLNIDGVIATNTTLARDAVQGLEHSAETGGLSGAPVHQQSLKVIQTIRDHAGPDFPIIGVGGIMSGQDAKDTFNAGANAIQLYSGLIYRGPRLIKECLNAFQALPKR